MADTDFIRQIETVAAGRIRCECSNDDWQQFLFAGASKDFLMAGCKKCGTTRQYANGVWIRASGPAVKPSTGDADGTQA